VRMNIRRLWPCVVLFALLHTNIAAEDLLVEGSWEVTELLTVDDSVLYQPEAGSSLELGRVYMLDVMIDGVAYVYDPGGDATEVTWSRAGNVLEIYYPDDGDFQYVEYYHLTTLDDWSYVAVIYASVSYPRVAVMRYAAAVGRGDAPTDDIADSLATLYLASQ